MPTNRRFRFTDSAIKKLKPEDHRVEYVDSSRKGLRLRITPTGTKTFIFRYRFNDRARLLTIGEYGPALSLEQANQKLGNARISLKDKTDPGEIKQKIIEGEKAEKFIPDLIDEYLEHHAKIYKTTWQEDARILNKDVRNTWKFKKAKDVKRRDIVLLLDQVKKRGIPTRNRLLSRISKMFRIGVERDIVDASPAVGIARLPEPARKRVLKDDEIKTFWKRLESADATDYIKTALRILLVTGQRRGELAHAEWQHVDLVKGEWFMPRTKNGEPHRLPLSHLAIELFTTLKQQTRESKWVLPSHRVQPEDLPITERAMTRAMANNRDHFGIEHFTPHDLRRTFRTKLSELKIDRATAEATINHLAPKIERTYNTYDYWDEMTEAVETWAVELQRITGVSE